MSARTPRSRVLVVRLLAAALWLTVLTLPPAGALAAPRRAAAGVPAAGADLWYVIKIAGQPAGYIHEETAARADGLTTRSRMFVALNRLGSRVEIGFDSESEETPDGLLRRVLYEMTASSQSTRSEAVIGAGKIDIRSESGGKTYTSSLSYGGDLYGPEGVRRRTESGLRKPGDTITTQTYVAEASLVGNMTRTVLSRETLRLGEREFAALKVEEVLEGLPIKRTGWLDEQGNLLRQDEPGPFGMIEIWRSDQSAALAAAAGGELPQEVYKSSIIRSNIRLPRTHPIDSIKVALTHRRPELGWPDFRLTGQKVLSRTDSELVLEVRRPQAPAGVSFPAARKEEDRQYLEPNAFIQSDDAEILRLAREIVGGEKDAFRALLALERWVAENMKFDLGIVFAPATEIIRNRRGTCVGYATLLATLARASGIPSRVVMGYVYALGMFGGHAWAEARLGEEWVPLDAAVVNEGVADAARVAVAASSLAEGMGELTLGAAQQVFGQIGISVREFESGGKTRSVSPQDAPFSLSEDHYDNPWLGIRLGKPAGFRFAKTDAVWPDRTLVSLDGPEGRAAVLEQSESLPWEEPELALWERLESTVPGGKKGSLKTATGDALCVDSAAGLSAAAAVRRGAEVWILKADGKDASATLRQVAGLLEVREK